MKAILINVGFLSGLAIVYYTDVLALFASEYAFIYSLIPVAVLLLIGLRVFGNPFRRGKNDD